MSDTTSKQALLITGGSGTVGRPLAEYFVSGGYRVYLLARHPEAAALEIGERGRPVIMDLEAFVLKGLAAFHGHLDNQLNPGQLAGIVHTAALLPSGSEAIPAQLLRVNVTATDYLWQWAVQRRIPAFVFTSGFNFLARPHTYPITEEHLQGADNVYGLSKMGAEMILASAAECPTRTYTLRLSSPVPPKAALLQRTVVRIMLERAVNKQTVHYFSKGERRQNFVATEDVAQAVHCCLRSEATPGLYNIAAPDSLRMRALAELIGGHFGAVAQSADQPDPLTNEHWNISIDKARKALGYAPRFTSADSIGRLFNAETIAFFRNRT